MKAKMFLLLSTSIVLFNACSNDTAMNADNASDILSDGNWKVTSYIDSGQDETYKFTGHSFDFTSGGTVNVTASSGNTSGSWSTGEDDSTVKLNLSFNSTPHSDLNDDWHVITQTNSKIELQDVSGGNGGVDYLTLER